jgi:hypothetical protein
MVKAREVTKEEEDWIKDNLNYDPDTGHLWWTKRGSGRQTDRPVGTLDHHGYVRVSSSRQGIKKQKKYVVHRLAWFLYYGVWPKDQIDHINNVRDDNRIVNLREATASENHGNRKFFEGGSSKYKGVHWYKQTCKWHAQIRINYKKIHLGSYDNEKEAALAYNKAALETFGEFAKINIIEPLDTGITNTYISSSSGELTC